MSQSATYESVSYVSWPGRFSIEYSEPLYNLVGWNIPREVIGPGNVAHGVGQVLSFDALGASVLSHTGFGLPEISYITSGGPCIDGERLDGYRLLPREMTVNFAFDTESREEYYNFRRYMLGVLRPTENLRPDDANPALTAQELAIINQLGYRYDQFGPGILRVTMANGETYEIDAVPSDGLAFNANDTSQWDQYSSVDSASFIAHDPVWRRSGIKTVRTATENFDTPVDYEGTWPEYGIFVTDPVPSGANVTSITLNLNGNIIAMQTLVGVSTDDVIIMDTRPGRRNIFSVSPAGVVTNQIGGINLSVSDIDSCKLRPQDYGRRNIFRWASDSAAVFWPVSYYYYDRFIGI